MTESEDRVSQHEVAHTVDPRTEFPDDPMPAAGTTPEQGEAIKAENEAHREAVEAQVAEQAERDAQFDESDPKPKPSELLADREPREADTGADSSASDPASDAGPDEDKVPDGSVQDVLDWVGDDQARAQAALDSEKAGQNRTTLISELEKKV